ncbi:hypothetical protein POM88_033676 [Heracleum sosnowskyi]|uniref:Uncharacterized protein n=1 Tax=Heracleum sosnowskyi TaxID=360622 RepID=A0AAD8HI48_9APIA|nr:hypothetical protein POM88_033676 [Heracleum sosnowskyi]
MITVVPDVKWSDMKKALSNHMKCEVCKCIGAVIVSGGKNIPLTQEHNGVFVHLMEINSSFFEPVECVFSYGWKAETMTSKKLNNIDLSAGKFLLIFSFSDLMEINTKFVELVTCIFSHGWKAKIMAGKKFNNIDLTFDEFYDYDKKCGCFVSSTNLRAIFEVIDELVDGGSSSLLRNVVHGDNFI